MLKESRPHMEKTLANLETASGKVSPTIDNVNGTIGKANKLTDHLDAVVVENRKEIHDTLLRLQTSLADAERMINDLDDTLGANRGNLDETLENIRATSENLKEFTDTLKQRPYSLIRIKAEKDRLAARRRNRVGRQNRGSRSPNGSPSRPALQTGAVDQWRARLPHAKVRAVCQQ